jgi:hypothetical protein
VLASVTEQTICAPSSPVVTAFSVAILVPVANTIPFFFHWI